MSSSGWLGGTILKYRLLSLEYLIQLEPERMSSSGWLGGCQSSGLISSSNAAASLQTSPSTSQQSHHWHSLFKVSSEYFQPAADFPFFTASLENFPPLLTDTGRAKRLPKWNASQAVSDTGLAASRLAPIAANLVEHDVIYTFHLHFSLFFKSLTLLLNLSCFGMLGCEEQEKLDLVQLCETQNVSF